MKIQVQPSGKGFKDAGEFLRENGLVLEARTLINMDYVVTLVTGGARDPVLSGIGTVPAKDDVRHPVIAAGPLAMAVSILLRGIFGRVLYDRHGKRIATVPMELVVEGVELAD